MLVEPYAAAKCCLQPWRWYSWLQLVNRDLWPIRHTRYWATVFCESVFRFQGSLGHLLWLSGISNHITFGYTHLIMLFCCTCISASAGKKKIATTDTYTKSQDRVLTETWPFWLSNLFFSYSFYGGMILQKQCTEQEDKGCNRILGTALRINHTQSISNMNQKESSCDFERTLSRSLSTCMLKDT